MKKLPVFIFDECVDDNDNDLVDEKNEKGLLSNLLVAEESKRCQGLFLEFVRSLTKSMQCNIVRNHIDSELLTSLINTCERERLAVI